MRVMTLNIWNYTRPWPARRDMIAELIDTHRPDAVALQETRHDFRNERGRWQGEQIASLTGYHATSAVAQVYFPILRVDEGLTILTSEAPVEKTVFSLSQLPHERHDENRRICLGGRLKHSGRTVTVIDTHFSLSRRARLKNAAESARFASEWGGDDLTVLMGDLNAEPSEESIRHLIGEVEVDGERGDFVDCWTMTHPQDAGFTYASFDPVRRIDYVLARNIPEGVIAAFIVGGDARDGVYPSDHLGIVVDVPL